MEGNNKEIVFTDKILDNVHGFIDYTEAEGKIIEMLIFKRLQSIKQLSIVNWIFPGSEHTRYTHSLGVMHICDKIAIQLHLNNYERRIVRFAGLLHDIGHYPLSHVGESPYKNKGDVIFDETFCKSHNDHVKFMIDTFLGNAQTDFMSSKSQSGHHEKVGATIIENNSIIRNIITEECESNTAVEIICDMITGNADRPNANPLLVQILHSELDADGIDYMLRDATFSGTSFGSFELDMLIKCMVVHKYNYNGDTYDILCITPKAIAAADQYLINKFFSTSQIIFNKHVSILEWMAEVIVNWMMKNNTYFPDSDKLYKWTSKEEIDKEYLSFNDNYFWASLQKIIDNPARKTFPQYIINLCEGLLTHKELNFVDKSEYKIISDNVDTIKSEIEKSYAYKHLGVDDNHITLLNTKRISNHIPYTLFEESIIAQGKELEENQDENSESKKILGRLMDGICVSDGIDLHLLCDDNRSLMQKLYNINLVVLRSYSLK